MSAPKGDDPKEVKALFVFRDFFKSFDDVIVKASEYENKYGISLKEAIQDGLTGPDTLQNLVKSLSAEGLGSLIQAAAAVGTMSRDLASFTKYDSAELIDLHGKLALLVQKFDTILRERR